MTDPIVWALSDRPALSSDVVVWAIVRNFRMTARAWLDHHRKFGVTRFVLLDDRSDDGTRELLLAEPDCLVVESKYRFGEMVGGERINNQLKNAIVDTFVRDRWGLHLDSDEFLFLPAAYDHSLPKLLATLERHGLSSANAVLVDFYPESPTVLFESPRVEYDPFAVCPYFDRGPYVIWSGGDTPFQIHGGIRETLLRRYGMLRRLSTNNVGPSARREKQAAGNETLAYTKTYQMNFDRRLYDRAQADLRAKTHLRAAPWVFKTPLVKWTGGRRFVHDHHLGEASDARTCIALAHFKFAPGLHETVPQAKERKQYTQGSVQYSFYSLLLERLRTEPSLLHRKSRRLASEADLEAVGLVYDRLVGSG